MDHSFSNKHFLDFSPCACLLMSGDHQVKYVNTLMAEFLGLSVNAEGPVTNFINHLTEDSQKTFHNLVKEMSIDSDHKEWKVLQIINAEGENRNFLVNLSNQNNESNLESSLLLSAVPLDHIDQNTFISASLSEDHIRKFANKKFESVFDSTVIGIAVLDHNGYVTESNLTFRQHLGLGNEDVRHKHYSSLFNNENRGLVRILFEQIKNQEKSLVKEVLTIEANDTGQHFIVEISLSPFRDEYDEFSQFMIITENITDLQDTQTALIQSEKLALTGRLAASLAHEINNPLQTSLGCLGLAEEMLEEDDRDLRVYINMAIDELQRSARIVKKLRDLNRKTLPADKSPVDLQEVFDSVLVLTKNRLYDRNIIPVFPYQGDPALVMGSKDQIQQVILNIMMNAIDALPEGGNIYIDLLETKKPPGYTIKIRDTGMGMPPEVQSNLFDPFFTTKETGIGLGLFISKKIIDDHSGSISVESELNKGTSFEIWLPGLDFPEEKE